MQDSHADVESHSRLNVIIEALAALKVVPSTMDDDTEVAFRTLGFAFAPRQSRNSLTTSTDYPPGWHYVFGQETRDRFVFRLQDSKDRCRGFATLMKDMSACTIELRRRYSYRQLHTGDDGNHAIRQGEEHPNRGLWLTDARVPIELVGFHSEREKGFDDLQAEAQAILAQRYPDYKNINAYWD